MKSIMYSEFGDPQTVLQASTSPQPQPQPGEVRIRTLLSPIHNHDLATIGGIYGYRPQLPAIGGSEAVGVIDALGDGVQQLQVGQRVCVAGVAGTWAEYFVAPAARVLPVPEAISDEQAAQLLAMPLSALALLDHVSIPPGAWLIQNAANGAVGKMLAVLAKSRGLSVIHLVRRHEAVAELQRLGIAHVLCSADDSWREQLAHITQSQPVVAAIDSVGGAASADLAQVLSAHGRLISFGAMQGEALHIPPGALIFKNIQVSGFWVTQFMQDIPAQRRAERMGELLGLAVQQKLVLETAGVYDLAHIATAVRASLTPGKQGKVLLRPAA